MKYNFLPKINRIQLSLIKIDIRMLYCLTFIFFMMLIFLWYISLFSMFNRMIAYTHAEIQNKQGVINQIDDIQKIYRMVRHEYGELKQLYDVHSKQPSFQEVIFMILDQAIQNDLKIISYEAGSLVTNAEFSSQALNLHLEGSFELFNQFLKAFITSPFLLTIKKMSITSVQNSNLCMNLILDLHVVKSDEQKNEAHTTQ